MLMHELVLITNKVYHINTGYLRQLLPVLGTCNKD